MSLIRLSDLVEREPETLRRRFAKIPALVFRSASVAGAATLSLEDTQADEDGPRWSELYRGDSEVIPVMKREGSLAPGVVTIGRGDVSDIMLRDPKVSKLHALLRKGQYGWLLQDLSSRNGTYHNQRKLLAGAEFAIASGDEIRFGDTRGVFADLQLLETLCSYVRGLA